MGAQECHAILHIGKGGKSMNYKRRIIELLDKIEEDDIIFLKQIYTIIKRHIEKRKSH